MMDPQRSYILNVQLHPMCFCVHFFFKSMLPMFVGCIHVFSLVDYIPGALLALGT